FGYLMGQGGRHAATRSRLHRVASVRICPMIMKPVISLGPAAVFLAALSAFCQTNPSQQQQIETHSRQAQEYLKNNRPDLAAQEFSAIVALDPNNLEARGNLGVLLFFQGDFANAAEQLRAALQLQPSLWKIQ